MKKIDRLKKKWTNYKYDHITLLNGLKITRSTALAIISAALYAFGFYCFITPAVVDHMTTAGSSIVTGGVGGISQVFALILDMCGLNVDPYLVQSIGYFVLNIPILIFAYFKIGKKFAIITLVNVGLSSAFIQVFNHVELMHDIAQNLSSQHLTRVLLAGMSVGLASSMAYKGEVSCGGIDVISYYFSNQKSTNVGKYSAMINGSIITTYTILTLFINRGQHVDVALLNFLYSLLYILVCTLVVDFINTRNKKVSLQIITEHEDMSSILISNFPHANTLVDAKGGYSGAKKKIIYMVISSNEVKKVVDLIKRVDERAFVTVTALVQAYGHFFIKPVE